MVRFNFAVAVPLALAMAQANPTSATDPGADYLTKLFTNACIPNIGRPDGVRAWAAQHHLAEVQNPAAVSVYVGAGEGGALWAVPSTSGMFALSVSHRRDRRAEQRHVHYADQRAGGRTLSGDAPGGEGEGVAIAVVKLRAGRGTTSRKRGFVRGRLSWT